MPAAAAASPRPCGACGHFQGDPHRLEGEVPGLATMASAFATTCTGTGLCALHGRYVLRGRSCADFVARPAVP